jgi:hypothetical protein
MIPRVTSRLGVRWTESSDIPKDTVKWRKGVSNFVGLPKDLTTEHTEITEKTS